MAVIVLTAYFAFTDSGILSPERIDDQFLTILIIHKVPTNSLRTTGQRVNVKHRVFCASFQTLGRMCGVNSALEHHPTSGHERFRFTDRQYAGLFDRGKNRGKMPRLGLGYKQNVALAHFLFQRRC